MRSNFNPRSHERSDTMSQDWRGEDMISIHAPTRGATQYHASHLQSTGISIHAPTRGATISVITTAGFDLFQSTLPREERPFVNRIVCGMRNFNPRSHERSDIDKALASDETWDISIHAPTRGATKEDGSLGFTTYISIHAPTRGATCKSKE